MRKPRTPAEAAALIAAYEAAPEKPRGNPEWQDVAVPIKLEMEKAGFIGRFLGKKVFNGRRWVSAVPKDTLDWYWHHPVVKLSIWVETKASGERPTPGQEQFIADHAGSDTLAVWWDDPSQCVLWLTAYGFRTERDGAPYYPFGLHA